MYALFCKKIGELLANEEGATAVEYGVMVALVAAVIIGTVVVLGTKLQSAFQAIISGF
ncbi:MAG: Flp family type IVb pilin [Candidatus Aquicultorales bacterium]